MLGGYMIAQSVEIASAPVTTHTTISVMMYGEHDITFIPGAC